MTASTITVKNAAGSEKELATDVDVLGVHTPKHREDDAQRLALLEKLQEIVDASGGGDASAANQATANTKLEAIRFLLAGTIVAAPSADQDPIFDHVNATKTTVTASVVVLDPAAGHKFARVSSDVDCFIRTDGLAAADAAGSIRIVANQPEVIPVEAGVDVTAYAASTAVVRVTPMKARA